MPPREPRSAEWVELLDAQRGVVSKAQALSLGVSLETIRWRVESGRWRRVYHGVYATFTGALPRQAALWAVVLRVGSGAVLSHETAAEVQKFSDRLCSTIHITVPARAHPARHGDLRGVVVHRSANWQADPQPPWQLPRTPVNETVLDLVASAPTLDDAYGWLSRAVTRRVTTPGLIADALAARKKMARRTWLGDALTDVSDGVHFPLERRWVHDVERAHGLPRATRQARRGGVAGMRYLDNLYAPYRLCVELDGVVFHPDDERAADRRRDNETILEDDTKTLRYGFPEVANRPCDQAVQVARGLISRGWQARTLKPCAPACPINAIAHDRGLKTRL